MSEGRASRIRKLRWKKGVISDSCAGGTKREERKAKIHKLTVRELMGRVKGKKANVMP